jgi:ankyrin repeat protein
MADLKLALTEEERRTLEADQASLKAAREANDALGTSNAPLLEGAVEVGELTYWSSLGNVAKVKFALQKSADVNHADADGYTALHAAAENGDVEIVGLLLAQGADRSRRAMGKTPANLATAHPEVLQLLSAK